MTGLPAWRLGLRDRGLIAPGMKADITLFDQTRVKDTATYQDPHRFPDGIDYVLVNGSVVIDSGRHTKTLVGKMLRKNT
jgi:N-acyl-D-aspartate/D-glutamate deacylase